MFSLSDYNYTLPPELIAQTPAHPPESCKFLVYDKIKKTTEDRIFSDLPQLIDPNTLIIFNNSKVIKARLILQKGILPLSRGEGAGGWGWALEIFYLNSLSSHTFNALIRPGKKFKRGNTIHFNENIHFTVDKRTEDGRQLTCNQPILEVLEQYGQMPLPPYIKYEEDKADPYQPIMAEKEGSVAAPTASLHFTQNLIKQLVSQGVQTAYTTLHVWLGTFKQVDTEEIKKYNIHAETIEIDLSLFERIAQHKEQNKPILAVGTTVTRTLESLPYLRKILQSNDQEITWQNNRVTLWQGGQDIWIEWMSFEGFEKLPLQTISFRNHLTTNITLDQAKIYIWGLKLKAWSLELIFSSTLYIYPGFTYKILDQLITNFHLPKSSLLMLVAWYIGYKEMKQVYEHAISEKYRFYSFGDAMLIK